MLLNCKALMTAESPAESCSYCGRATPNRLSVCVECGTPLVSEPPPPTSTQPAKKSKVVAVCLSLVFGPLGLIYVGAWWPAFVLLVIGVPFILTHKGGLWLTIGGRIVAAVWAYCLVLEHDESPNVNRDASRLLDKAARLESVDFSKAIAAYEEVVRLYPDTRASKQAANSIETLKKQSNLPSTKS